MSEKIDPELVDDKDDSVVDDTVPEVDLPDYDPTEFELPDDYEFVEDEEDGDDDGSEG